MIPRRKPRFHKGELRDILRLVLSRQFSNGDYIGQFENKMAGYTGTKHAISTCSGRNSMELILEALRLNKGDEIIIPAYTLKDLIYLIQKKGLIIKLADIEEDTFNIDPRLVEKKITGKTKVIMVTHLFGLPCNIEEIIGIAKRHNVYVIEDCTHALGATRKGKKVGSFGKAGFFSFEATKPINTFGGGMVVTDDDSIAGAVRNLVNSQPFDYKSVLSKMFFIYLERVMVATQLFALVNLSFLFRFTKKGLSKIYVYLHSRARAQSMRFTNLQAFLGIRQLSDLDERNGQRNKTALKLTERLNLNSSIRPQHLEDGRIFYFYVIKYSVKKDLEGVRRQLLLNGIDAGIKEEITDDCSLIVDSGDSYPVVKDIFNSAIQLPMYDGFRDKDLDYTVKALEKALR